LTGGAFHRAILGPRIALALLAVSGSAAAAERMSFHHLDGASTKLQVKRLFPEARPYALCRGRAARLADGVYTCAGLQLDHYTLDGRTFSAIFNFKTTGYLSGILLTKQVGYSFLPAADRLSKHQLDELFDRLDASLSRGHGKPLPDYSPCPVGAESLVYRRCSRWQPGRSSRRRPGHDHVDLELDVQREADDSEAYAGLVTISYEFAANR